MSASAVVGVFHAQGLLYVEFATLFLHLDDDCMPFQSHEFIGQADVVGCEADAGIGGIGHTQIFSVSGVLAVVVGHDDYAVVDGDADKVAQCEAYLRHVFFGEIQHGCTEFVVRCDFTFQGRQVFGVVVVVRASSRHE